MSYPTCVLGVTFIVRCITVVTLSTVRLYVFALKPFIVSDVHY